MDIEKLKNGGELDVYIHQSIVHGNFQVFRFEKLDGHVTIAKGKCSFEFMSEESVIQEAVEAFDQQIKDTYAEAEIKVGHIKDMKAKFLSITDQSK